MDSEGKKEFSINLNVHRIMNMEIFLLSVDVKTSDSAVNLPELKPIYNLLFKCLPISANFDYAAGLGSIQIIFDKLGTQEVM